MTEPSQHPHDSTRPADWSQSDSLLQQEIRAEMRRIVRDEDWIARTDRRARIDWWMALGALVLAGLAVGGIVLSVIALNRDIEAVATAELKDDSIGSRALRAGSVDARALADRAVTATKIAAGAVGADALAAKSVGARAVAADALTGAHIDEATLGRVRSAGNAVRLAGLPIGSFMTATTVVTFETETTSTIRKGPVVADCPTGSRVIGGGAEVIGATNVALTQSTPAGTTAWTATARRQTSGGREWKLVVRAICGIWGRS